LNYFLLKIKLPRSFSTAQSYHQR